MRRYSVLTYGVCQAAGAFCFATCMFGWWIFIAIVLETVDFPISLPVGDLSHYVKGKSSRMVVRRKGDA